MAIQINGLNGLLDTLDGAADVSKIENSLMRACLVVEAAAKQKAGGAGIKDTGNLANSIKSKVEAVSGEIEGIVYTPVEYAPYVEFGTGLFAENGGRTDVPWKYQDDKGNWHTTRGQKPQPFLRPALDENKDKIIEILGEGLLND
jgi:HK97 gp10 family phage protein